MQTTQEHVTSYAFIPNPPPVRNRFATCKLSKSHSTQPTNITILGGSSGVGLQAAKYLRSKGIAVKTFSRSTGHDLNSAVVANAALEYPSGGVGVCLGAGRTPMSIDGEIKLYTNVITALSRAKDAGLVVLVVRSIVLPDVERLLRSALKGPWVILRPGAMVDRVKCVGDGGNSGLQEKLLVTPDMRCNGLVSRCSVGRVLGELLLGSLTVNEIDKQVLGVYDEERMVSMPRGVKLVGRELWGCPMY